MFEFLNIHYHDNFDFLYFTTQVGDNFTKYTYYKRSICLKCGKYRDKVCEYNGFETYPNDELEKRIEVLREFGYVYYKDLEGYTQRIFEMNKKYL